MKILMTALHPSGGIRTFFRYVYGQAFFESCEFVLIAPDDGLKEFLSTCLPPDRIKLIVSNRRSLGFVQLVRKVFNSGSFDLVHSHGFSAGVLTELALTSVNVPHMMTAHDVFTPPQFFGWKGAVKKFMLSIAFSRITAVHTVTEDAKSNFLEYFPRVDSRRVYGILHGVDTRFFRDGVPRKLKDELSLANDVPLIGFFGRFMGQKGFKVLIDAMDHIINQENVYPLPHVVTFSSGGYMREDYAYLEEKGLSSYFHPLKPTDDMPSALKGVDLVVMPSRWEACGLLAMESLAAGVPIIGTDCVGLREILDGSPAKVSKSGNSCSLSEVISRDLEVIAERELEFKAFQPIAVEKFNILRPARELLALYTDLANLD